MMIMHPLRRVLPAKAGGTKQRRLPRYRQADAAVKSGFAFRNRGPNTCVLEVFFASQTERIPPIVLVGA